MFQFGHFANWQLDGQPNYDGQIRMDSQNWMAKIGLLKSDDLNTENQNTLSFFVCDGHLVKNKHVLYMPRVPDLY